MAHEPSVVSQRRKAADIVDKRMGARYCLRILTRKSAAGWGWFIRKSWYAHEIDEVVLIAGLRKAWEEAERAGRVKRAQRTEQLLEESWQTPEEEER